MALKETIHSPLIEDNVIITIAEPPKSTLTALPEEKVSLNPPAQQVMIEEEEEPFEIVEMADLVNLKNTEGKVG